MILNTARTRDVRKVKAAAALIHAEKSQLESGGESQLDVRQRQYSRFGRDEIELQHGKNVESLFGEFFQTLPD